MMDWKSFFQIMLGLPSENGKDAEKLPRVRRVKRKQGKPARRQVTNLVGQLLVRATWLLILSSLISLVGIIAIPLLRPDVEVPSVLSQIITLTLGYFGGAISAFLRINADVDEGNESGP